MRLQNQDTSGVQRSWKKYNRRNNNKTARIGLERKLTYTFLQKMPFVRRKGLEAVLDLKMEEEH